MIPSDFNNPAFSALLRYATYRSLRSNNLTPLPSPSARQVTGYYIPLPIARCPALPCLALLPCQLPCPTARPLLDDLITLCLSSFALAYLSLTPDSGSSVASPQSSHGESSYPYDNLQPSGTPSFLSHSLFTITSCSTRTPVPPFSASFPLSFCYRPFSSHHQPEDLRFHHSFDDASAQRRLRRPPPTPLDV